MVQGPHFLQLLAQNRVYIDRTSSKSDLDGYLLRFTLHVALFLSAACVVAQQPPQQLSGSSVDVRVPTPVQQPSVAASLNPVPNTAEPLVSSSANLPEEPRQTTALPAPQPKRILGIMPNYRAVSAGAIPPPPGPKEAFKIATENSFDYSSFVFTGLTSLLAKGTDAHPDLGKGIPGLWAYTWRGFLDKTDGNYLVIWALPSLLHQDERYFAMGRGSKWRRFGYSLSQVAIARDYNHHAVFNYSEVLGRAGAQAVSTAYYPAEDRNWSDLSAKYAYSLLRDGATNAFREFWPDINSHVLHRHSD